MSKITLGDKVDIVEIKGVTGAKQHRVKHPSEYLSNLVRNKPIESIDTSLLTKGAVFVGTPEIFAVEMFANSLEDNTCVIVETANPDLVMRLALTAASSERTISVITAHSESTFKGLSGKASQLKSLIGPKKIIVLYHELLNNGKYEYSKPIWGDWVSALVGFIAKEKRRFKTLFVSETEWTRPHLNGMDNSAGKVVPIFTRYDGLYPEDEYARTLEFTESLMKEGSAYILGPDSCELIPKGMNPPSPYNDVLIGDSDAIVIKKSGSGDFLVVSTNDTRRMTNKASDSDISAKTTLLINQLTK